MYCKNCGSPIDEHAVFCPHCGVSQEMSAPVKKKDDTNVLAIVGFILSFFVAIAGLVCSVIGLKKAPELGGNGHGLALAGLIISIVSIAFSFIAVIIYIALLGSFLAAL